MLFNKQEFLDFVIKEQLLRFGNFTTKSGRQTPYFFNIGNIQLGSKLYTLADFYARYIIDHQLTYPTIFGPAYKGISLAIATSIALSKYHHEIAFSYNRKEIKNHGEKGNIIGANLQGNILIIDDVITSGMSIQESIQIIHNNNATPKSVVVALNRQEPALNSSQIAKEYLQNEYNISIHALLELKDIIQ